MAELWRRGSVVSSWLLDLTAQALRADPDLERFGGRVSDSGEGRWTLQAAVDVGVPADVLAAALFGRFTSQGQADFAHRMLSAMRKEFGGHDEKPAAGGRGGDAQACRTRRRIVIFGASGDLTKRKLLPAFFHLYAEGLLPHGFALVGYARTQMTDEEFHEYAREAVAQFSKAEPSGEVWEDFTDHLSYVAGRVRQRAGDGPPAGRT